MMNKSLLAIDAALTAARGALNAHGENTNLSDADIERTRLDIAAAQHRVRVAANYRADDPRSPRQQRVAEGRIVP
jgi:hypothetical protein